LCALAITAFAVAPAAASAAGEPIARMTCTAPGLVCDPCTVQCTSPTGSVPVGAAIAFDGRVSSDDRVGAPSGTVVSWVWSFGDGATASEAQPSHAYAVAKTYSVTLTVTDDSDLTDTKRLEFIVHAVPSASVAPLSLGFSATAGTSSVPRTVTMTNNGDAPLTISNVALDGANPERFSIVDGCTSPVPASGGHCTVDVTFNPTTAGESTATLIFTDNHQGTPNATQTVQLSGTGIPPPVASTVAPPPPPPPLVSPPPPPPTGAQTDRDNDGVPDAGDSCVATAGNLRNGCPGELDADIRGSWRVNALLSQLLSLTVRTHVGSRIEIRCSGNARVCGFRTKVIKRTTRRTTSLTSYFKGPRILPDGTVIVVRVTRPLQRGTYERLQTRRGRKLPKVLNKCLSAGTAKVQPCADD